MNSSFHADIYYTEHKILVGQPVLPKQCPSFLLFWALSKKKKKTGKKAYLERMQQYSSDRIQVTS